MGYCRQLVLACFICNMVFDRYFDISGSCCNIYFYRTKAKDINNTSDEIPIFKLHGITEYLSLYYLTIKEFKLQQVKLK